MKLTCKKCHAEIAIAPQDARDPEARIECPGCGARYKLKPRTAAPPARATSAAVPADVSRATPNQTLTHATPGTSTELPTTVGPKRQATANDARADEGVGKVFYDGELVANRYRIVRFLAQGGMGQVFEAEDLELRQRVALKTVSPQGASFDVAAIERFKREIALSRTVTHPNVCRIFDLGQHELGPDAGRFLPSRITFLTMELLHGETLAHRLRRTGRMMPEEAFPLVRQMVEALQAAHDARVVHRDFKSENVFLVPAAAGTRVVVTDFGVARGVGAEDGFAAQLTGTGIVGTPAYMAPEQIEGKPVGPAADLYALGIVIYEMVTARLPFESDNPLTSAVKRLNEPPPPPRIHAPDLPVGWERTILRCLERHPERRFAKVQDVVQSLATPAAMVDLHAPSSRSPPLPRPPAAAPPATPPPSAAGGTATAGATPTERGALYPPAAARRHAADRRLRTLTAVLAAVVVVSGLLYLWNQLRQDPSRVRLRRSVAVLGFRNLTGDPEVAWLSTALAEMLTTELSRGEDLRTIPGDAVARARQELGLEDGGAPPDDALPRLRTLLGSDFLVYGSYARVAAAGGGELRLDVRLVDAAVGTPLTSLARTGGEGEVFAMVASAGEELRDELDAGSAADGDDPLAGLPSEPEAARLYAQALEQLRGSHPEAAREMLQRATVIAPRNPLIHSALSAAWEAEGYDQRAAESAARAFELSSRLPREDRLVVEGRHREAQGDYQAAAAIYRTLRESFPDDLEYGLRLVAVETAGHQPDQALATIAELRLLPPALAEDPRLDLAEAAAAAAVSDFDRQLAAAARAVERAGQLGAGLLVAQARLVQSQAYRALGQPAEAEEAAAAAQAIYGELDNPAGTALALTTRANALVDRGELDAAADSYREAIETYRRIGDQGGLASSLNNLATALRRKGELDEAQQLYEESENIYRATGDRLALANALNNQGVLLVSRDLLSEAQKRFESARTIWEEIGNPASVAYGLNNVAAVLRLKGQLAESQEMQEKALAVRREIGQRIGEVASLNNLGSVLADRGELTAAEERHAEALTVARAIGDRSGEAEALYGLGQVRIDRGALEGAREAHEQALALRTELDEKRRVTESRIAMARLALAEDQPATAEIVAQNAVRVCERENRPAEEARARVILATAQERQGRPEEAREAIAAAVPLAERSEQTAIRLEVWLTAARLRAAGLGDEAAFLRLDQVASEAERLGYAGLRLEALLAAAEARHTAGDATLAQTLLDRVQSEAAERGYALIQTRAGEALGE